MVVGLDAGFHNYTVGQRRGLGVAAREPLYVIATEAANRVRVGGPEELLTRRMRVRDMNWISVAAPAGRIRAQVRIRKPACSGPGECVGAGTGASKWSSTKRSGP
jgi:tRNA-specific 2-thiouridylase